MQGAALNNDGRSRLEIVGARAEKWADDLIDLSASNTLLSFKATKTTSLDLSNVDEGQLRSLLRGGRCRISALVADPDRRTALRKQATSVRRRIGQLEEEQGLSPARIGAGLLVTDRKTGGAYASFAFRAPLLLWPVALRSVQGGADFELEVVDEPEVNVVLLHALQRLLGIDVDVVKAAADLGSIADEGEDPLARIGRAADYLKRTTDGGQHNVRFDATHVALGLFSYEKLPMVNDLRLAKASLAEHDVIAALAGAPTDLAARFDPAWSPLPPDHIPPRDEYLVAEADSSQHGAINAVLHGHDAVIVGPPGTGKSQTIANIIAGAAALGKRVLFVAEKRAAIEAVTQRLEAAGLDGLVFDLHQRTVSRRDVARQLADTLDRAAKTPPAGAQRQLDDELYTVRRDLAIHAYELHTSVAPWGVSPYAVIGHLASLPPSAATDVRFRGAMLSTLSGGTLRQATTELQRFFDLGGPRHRRKETPWWNADIQSEDHVRDMRLRLDHLTGRALAQVRSDFESVLAQTGLGRPQHLPEWRSLLKLLQGVSASIDDLGPQIFDGEPNRLAQLAAATGDRSYRQTHDISLTWRKRRELVRQANSLSPLRKRALHDRLACALAHQKVWIANSVAALPPGQVRGLADVLSHFEDLERNLAAISMCVQLDGHLAERSTEEVEQRIRELDSDRSSLDHAVEIRELSRSLEALGLGHFLDDLCARQVPSDQVTACLFWAWLHSLYDELKSAVPSFGRFSRISHERSIARFVNLDREHLRRNQLRVQRSAYEHLHHARVEHPEQAQLIATEAKKKSKHKSIRELLTAAPDVLLSLHPCWAMSPLIVSRMLPAEQLFDLVIFDEASQVAPHDAVTSIMRGRQLVVAGDPQQLPPTNFFRKVFADDDEEEDLEDFESILDVLSPKLHRHMLRWHYRSTDERLIAFSNKHFYKDDLVAFPGSQAESPIFFEEVDGRAGPGAGGIASAEVERVVQLILEHAADRPSESLGVIALGEKHADAIDMALRRARKEHPETDFFFADELPAERRFFVKNLERVQGDERDAIIFSIGHAKAPNGVLSMQFGPLNKLGGERRLNVAITRAKRRLTVVASFNAFDMRTDGKARGVELLRKFIEYAANGQRLDTIGRSTGGDLNAFERSVLDAMLRRGMPVHPQWGVGEYRIDFAIAHPEQPGRMVLAVETDGDRYHRARSTRDRDRLRQSHLETLGWQFQRIWASEWLKNPGQEIERIYDAWRQAVTRSDDRTCDPIELREPPITLNDPQAAGLERGPLPFKVRDKASEHSDDELVALFCWMLTDGLLADSASRIQEVRHLLDIRRLSPSMSARLDEALRIAEHTAKRPS